MLDWHLGMLEGPGGEVRERLRLADALTLSRLAAAPFVGGAARRGAQFSALVAAAGATDPLTDRSPAAAEPPAPGASSTRSPTSRSSSRPRVRPDGPAG